MLRKKKKMNEQKPAIKAGADTAGPVIKLNWFDSLTSLLFLGYLSNGNDNNFCILVLLWMQMGKMSTAVHGTKIRNESISVYLLYHYNILEGNVMRQAA